jgi:PKD repeat protein
LQVTPGSVPASGGTLNLLALVRDYAGQGVANAPVSFLTEAGTLGSGGALVQTDMDGQAEDSLTLTVQDISALGRRTFMVLAQTIDSAGRAIEDRFVVQVQTGAPVADFTYVATGLTVQFNNQSTGDQPLSYLWDFGDGVVPNPDNRTETNPVHTYANPGTYNVNLTVTNAVGTDNVVKSVTVIN